jgi:hypothetical protein
MTMNQTSRNLRIGVRRSMQRLANHQSMATSPSEVAIRSINEKRSTPRW